MKDVGDQYKNQSEELKKLSAHYNNLNASIKEMNESYRLVGEKLEQIQAKTNEHSGTMTDSSPVVKIKESLKNILAEIKSMDVRMGVLNHTILQYKTKERNQNAKNNKNMLGEADEFDEF
jgi:intraflagellar transport protein 57